MKALLTAARTALPADEDADRGDVPGWVLVTMMTAGLVVLLWGVAGPALTGLFDQAIQSVSGAVTAEAERGSAPAEFVLCAVLLLVLVLGVLQVGAVLLVRNTALDAVAEGARWAAVVGNTDADGVARAQQVLTDGLGPAYAAGVSASRTVWHDQPATEVRATIPFPVLGLVGPPAAIEVRGHAALEPEP